MPGIVLHIENSEGENGRVVFVPGREGPFLTAESLRSRKLSVW
jgi:hypothetical protein